MAAADPEVDLELVAGDGKPTQANVDASAAGCPLKLVDTHWLKEAAGGVDRVLWAHLDAALLGALYFDVDDLDAVVLVNSALSLKSMAGVFRAALNNGLDRSSKGSMAAALYYLSSFIRSKRAEKRVEFTIDDKDDFHVVNTSRPANPGESAWIYKMAVPMCVDDDGDGVVLSAMAHVLPGRFTSTTRSQDDFKFCAIELYLITKESHGSLSGLSHYRQAMAVVEAIGANVPDVSLMTMVPIKRALSTAMSYRRSEEKALQKRFLNVWDLAFTNLKDLYTGKCSPREAWSFSSRLLESAPTFEKLKALDSRVGTLLGVVEADSDLAASTAPISSRVEEMERLLSTTSSSKAPAHERGSSGSTTAETSLDLAKVFAKPENKALISELEALNVKPLVEYRVIRTMLSNQKTPLGWQFLNGLNMDNPLFKVFKSCRLPSAIVEAFKRGMAVDRDNLVRTELYYLFDTDQKCLLPGKLMAGTFAEGTTLKFNPWLEAAAPRIKILSYLHGVPEQYNEIARANPAAMFSNEYMLRQGSEHLVEAFGFVGMAKEGEDSLAAVLASLQKYAFRIDLIPDALHSSKSGALDFTNSKRAARRILEEAAVRGFVDYATAIRSMLAQPALEAQLPPAFAPKDCGLRTTLARVEKLFKPIDGELELHQTLVQAGGALAQAVSTPSPPVLPIPPTAANLAVVASSESAQAPPPSPASAWGGGPPRSALNWGPQRPKLGLPLSIIQGCPLQRRQRRSTSRRSSLRAYLQSPPLPSRHSCRRRRHPPSHTPRLPRVRSRTLSWRRAKACGPLRLKA